MKSLLKWRLPGKYYLLAIVGIPLWIFVVSLKQMFSGREVLQYLFTDGEFMGAVLGHWRIGPHDIEDIKICLEHDEAEKRRNH
ncbi:hypothetical protein ACDX78_21105 [Virgibacillus oceani]